MLRAGGGDGVEEASVTIGAPAIQSRSSRPAHDRRRMRAAREQPRYPLDRQVGGRGDEHEVAVAAPLEHGGLGEQRGVREHVPEGRRLSPREGERPAVGDVHEQHAGRCEERRDLAVELRAGDMRRDARPAEHVDDRKIHRAAQRGGQLAERLARVAVADADARVLRPRQVFAHEVDEAALEFEHLLPRPRPGRLDVPRHRERAGAEVQGRERPVGQLVDDVAHAGDVFEEQLRRPVGVDVRLGCAVDDQEVAARYEVVVADDRVQPALESHFRDVGHGIQSPSSGDGRARRGAGRSPSRATETYRPTPGRKSRNSWTCRRVGSYS